MMLILVLDPYDGTGKDFAHMILLNHPFNSEIYLFQRWRRARHCEEVGDLRWHS